MSNEAATIEADEPRKKGTRMLWLVVGIPTMTVLGCLLTIFLAVNNPDFPSRFACQVGSFDTLQFSTNNTYEQAAFYFNRLHLICWRRSSTQFK